MTTPTTDLMTPGEVAATFGVARRPSPAGPGLVDAALAARPAPTVSAHDVRALAAGEREDDR